MSTTVVLNGVNYTIPSVGDTPPTTNWGPGLIAYLTALATAYGNTSPGFLDFVNVTTSPITGVSGKLYLVDTSGARTINLPAPANNAYIIVKDKTGGASSFNITIARNGSENIDGAAASKTLALDYGTWIIVSDGTDWFTLNDTNLLDLLSQAQTVSGVKTFSAQPVLTPSSNQLKIQPGGSGNSFIFTATNPAGDVTITIPDPGGAASLVVTAGAQTIAGAKTFSDQPVLTPSSNQLKVQPGASGFAFTFTMTNPGADRTITIADPGGAATILMTEGTYTVNAALTMGANIAMGGSYKLTGLAAGSTAGDSVRYEQVLLLAGGTMAGNIDMGSNDLTNVGNLEIDDDAPATPVADTLYADLFVKARCKVEISAGTPSISEDVNLDSITDNGVGDFTLVITTDMANAEYSVCGSAQYAQNFGPYTEATQLVGSCRIATFQSSTEALVDTVMFHAIIVGKQ